MVGKGEERGLETRRSNNVEVNGEGKRLCKYLKERGWDILNGNIEGDEEGEWTYTRGRGNSVIDYVIVNENTRERVERMELGERVDSDQHPVVVWLRGEAMEGERRARKGEGRKAGRGNWTAEGEERGIQEEWKELKERIKGAIGMVGARGQKVGKGGWWHKECREEKSKVRKELRRWRRDGGDGKE